VSWSAAGRGTRTWRLSAPAAAAPEEERGVPKGSGAAERRTGEVCGQDRARGNAGGWMGWGRATPVDGWGGGGQRQGPAPWFCRQNGGGRTRGCALPLRVF
jgi:hypothetical protein